MGKEARAALANFPGNKPAKGSPSEVKVPDKNDTTMGADSLASWRSRYKNSTFYGCVLVRSSLY